MPAIVRPFSFGAALVALEKSGGVHPIAVGCTLRRIVAKIAWKLGLWQSYLVPDS